MIILGQEWRAETVLATFGDMTDAERDDFLKDRIRVAGLTGSNPRRAQEWAQEELQRQEEAGRRLCAQARAEIAARKPAHTP